MIINFDSFGLHNPTTISFYLRGKDKKSSISFTFCNIEMVIATIQGLLKSLETSKAFYTTSPKLLGSIKQRTVASGKSLYEIFCDSGIKIEENGNE